MAPPIPITIITGFLGSGKTTLLLNLVPQLRAKNPSYRLALLKNEFGDVAIDSQLASSSSIAGVREMLNGCICCNMVGSLSSALDELTSREDVGPTPNRIVVETSGSAFPATLAMEVNRVSRETGGKYALDGVVSVIDVENWKGYEDTSYTARIQAKYTDLIVFNKWELCDEMRFDECLDRVGDLEVEIPWVKSDKGRVPVDVIFGIDGGLAKGLLGEGEGGGEDGHGHDHAHDHSHDHDHEHKSDHQTEVEVLSITLKKTSTDDNASTAAVVNGTKLMSLLNSALKEEVYRIKAVLSATPGTIKGSADEHDKAMETTTGRYILNWAFGRWTFTAIESNTTAEHASSDNVPLRMTMILARYESTKWKKRLESGDFLELEGGGELVVEKIA